MATNDSDTDKPKALTGGPSQAEGIGKFAYQMTYEDLSPERRERLKVSVLDSLACALSALGARTVTSHTARSVILRTTRARFSLPANMPDVQERTS